MLLLHIIHECTKQGEKIKLHCPYFTKSRVLCAGVENFRRKFSIYLIYQFVQYVLNKNLTGNPHKSEFMSLLCDF